MEVGERNLRLGRLLYRKALGDLESGRILLKNSRYADAVFHFQQSAEKSVKALLVLKDIEIREHIVSGYFASEIISEAEPEPEKSLRESLRALISLEEHAIKPRYPRLTERFEWDPERDYKPQVVEKAESEAELVVRMVEAYARSNFGVNLKLKSPRGPG